MWFESSLCYSHTEVDVFVELVSADEKPMQPNAVALGCSSPTRMMQTSHGPDEHLTELAPPRAVSFAPSDQLRLAAEPAPSSKRPLVGLAPKALTQSEVRANPTLTLR